MNHISEVFSTEMSDYIAVYLTLECVITLFVWFHSVNIIRLQCECYI
jgi:hypothetical protein